MYAITLPKHFTYDEDLLWRELLRFSLHCTQYMFLRFLSTRTEVFTVTGRTGRVRRFVSQQTGWCWAYRRHLLSFSTVQLITLIRSLAGLPPIQEGLTDGLFKWQKEEELSWGPKWLHSQNTASQASVDSCLVWYKKHVSPCPF